MDNIILYCVFFVLLIAIIVMLIISRKKNKEIIESEQKYTEQLTKTLSQTDLYLKYKKRVTLQAFITWAATFLLSISLILLVFLPIFQIKFELLGIELSVKNFSFYDNCIAVSNNYNEAAKCYTDVDKFLLIVSVVTIPAVAVYLPIGFFIYCIKTFNARHRTEKFIINTKTNRLGYPDLETIPFGYLICIGLLIASAVVCKNAEFKIESDVPYYTAIDLNNYICYYTSDGIFLFKVFQNYFKDVNAVSPLIALPIIVFVIAVCLYAVGTVLKVKLKNEIQNEEIGDTAPKENNEQINNEQ